MGSVIDYSRRILLHTQTMKILLICLLLIIGLINVAPIAGLFSKSLLERSYGILIADPNLEILLRHRAVLFGIVGSLVLISIAIPEWRLLALVMVGCSMISFFLLVLFFDNVNSQVLNIAYTDIVGILCWLFALALMFDSN
jgi:hypothetical protein